MKSLRAKLLPALCLIPVLLPLAFADQTDPQLDVLFTRLKLTDEADQVQFIENSIWSIWMAHDNDDVQQLLAVATQRMNAGRYPAAMLVFNELVTSYPDYAEAWNKRATLHYLLGDFAASLADIERTLELEPRHFGALSGQGLIFIQQEKLGEAEEAFEHLLTIHPNSPSAINNLEMVRAARSRRLI